MLLILFGCPPEVKLGPQTHACAVTFVYVVAVETVYSVYEKMERLEYIRGSEVGTIEYLLPCPSLPR